MSAHKKADKEIDVLARISDLSFVKSKPEGRCFWHVRSTGDPYKDEKLGQRFALEYLALAEADQGGPGHLQLIVGDIGPIEISFVLLISYAAEPAPTRRGASRHIGKAAQIAWRRKSRSDEPGAVGRRCPAFTRNSIAVLRIQ